MRFHEYPIVLADNPYRNDIDGANRRVGVGERNLSLGELEPKIVDVLGAGFDAP